jgi:hypothetical protein
MVLVFVVALVLLQNARRWQPPTAPEEALPRSDCGRRSVCRQRDESRCRSRPGGEIGGGSCVEGGPGASCVERQENEEDNRDPAGPAVALPRRELRRVRVSRIGLSGEVGCSGKQTVRAKQERKKRDDGADRPHVPQGSMETPDEGRRVRRTRHRREDPRRVRSSPRAITRVDLILTSSHSRAGAMAVPRRGHRIRTPPRGRGDGTLPRQGPWDLAVPDGGVPEGIAPPPSAGADGHYRGGTFINLPQWSGVPDGRGTPHLPGACGA